MKLVSVRDLATRGELRGRRVLLRADLNAPLAGGRVADDTRLRAARPTLELLRAEGARTALASHLGRPGGEPDPALSLRPVAEAMQLPFLESCVGSAAEERIAALQAGEALLLENLRFHAGEERNAPEFAAALGRLAGVYGDDAFGTAHRAHASTAGVTRCVSRSAAGLLLLAEIDALSRVRDSPESPFVCVLGGAKVSDKLAVLEALARRADTIAIGGAMAYTFLLARGEPIGRSRAEPELVDTARTLLDGPAEILLPVDHVVAERPDAASETVERIPDDRMALDIGPRSVERIRAAIRNASTVFWNGPLGLFETPPFDEGTCAVARTLAESGAFTVVGGGDSLAAVTRAGVAAGIDHLSTGGGAALEFIEGRTLPGVAALQESG